MNSETEVYRKTLWSSESLHWITLLKHFLGGETATKIATGENPCITKVDINGNTRDAVSDWTANASFH